jgi:hypothetical protein
MSNDLVRFLRERLDEDEVAARTASHVLRHGAHWSLDEWHGREVPHSLIAQGTADQPVALGHFTADPVPTEQAAHIARHDPARVLAEVDAKRQLLTLAFRHASKIDGEWGCCHSADQIEAGLCPEIRPDGLEDLRILALPYADHPDYRAEWRAGEDTT